MNRISLFKTGFMIILMALFPIVFCCAIYWSRNPWVHKKERKHE